MIDYVDFDIESGEEEDDESRETTGTDGLIFLIDSTQPMFSRLSEDEDVPFLLSMKCAHSTFTSKIISSEQDLLGIVCFGSQKTENSQDFPHISVFLELEQPSAKRILKIEEITREDEGVSNFHTHHGSNEDFSLSDALWVCQSMFANSRIKLTHKRVMLFTCVDDPHSTDTNKQTQARYRARDLEDNGILLELLHLGSYFDPSKFYEGLQILGDGSKLANPSEKLDELLMRVRRRNHKKRSTGRLTLNLGGDVKCAVAVYNLVRPARKPIPCSLDKRDNTEVKRMTQKYLVDTGEELLPSEMMMYQEYGEKKIKLTPDEVRSLKGFGQAGFTLIGFKPIEKVKSHYHIGPSSFIYPDDYNIQGSVTLFTALLERCSARGVAMFGWWVRSKASFPAMVALVPQKEVEDGGLQVTPPGFHIVPLPFADDFRELPPVLESTPRASQEQIDAMANIIKKLRAPSFSPEQIENPSLQTFWANIESLALDRDEVEPIEDCTQPDLDGMDRRTSKLVETFKSLVYPENYHPESTKRAPKRPAGEAGSSAKKQREDKYPDVDMKAEASVGKVEKLNVDVLKNFLMLQGVRVTGKKKAELVQEIYQHFK